jgi:hypothetical protein
MSTFTDKVNSLIGLPWMTYAKAAREARDVNSDTNRLATLEAKWLGNTTAATNIKSTWNVTWGTWENTMVDTSKFTEATWTYSKSNAQNAITSTFSATPTTTTSTPAPIVTNTDTTWTQWNTSTIKGSDVTKWKTQEQVVAWQTNKVTWELVATYENNKAIDEGQLAAKKAAIDVKTAETDAELKRQEAEKNALAVEEDRIQKEKAAEDAANLSALQEKERAANEASLAAAAATAAAAERELQIANDVELQKSNVAFAKLWLTLSTAAVTSAQQIYTTWVYNLSKLKSDNAYKQAKLEVDVAKVEFDHTTAINKIINDSSEKSYTIRKKLNEDISAIKNSIITNKYERQTKIDEAIDEYQKSISENENSVLEKMNKANEVLSKNTTLLYDALSKKEQYWKDKISAVISNGKWFAMTPAQRVQYEKAAWLEPWTTDHEVYSNIWTQVAKAFNWVVTSPWAINEVIMNAQKYMSQWIGLDAAVAMSLASSPTYQKAIAKTKSWGGSWSSSGWKLTIGTYLNMDTWAPETLREIWWIPVDSNWNQVDLTKYVAAWNASLSNITLKEPTWGEKLAAKVTWAPVPKARVTAITSNSDTSESTSKWKQ